MGEIGALFLFFLIALMHYWTWRDLAEIKSEMRRIRRRVGLSQGEQDD